jgi:hypothetical protein
MYSPMCHTWTLPRIFRLPCILCTFQKKILLIYTSFIKICFLSSRVIAWLRNTSLSSDMWDAHNFYKPLSIALQKQQNCREEFRVTKYLFGLQPNLAHICSQILSRNDIPTLNKTYARVRRASIPSTGVMDKCSTVTVPIRHYDTLQGEHGGHSQFGSRQCTHNGRSSRGCRSGGNERGLKKCSHCGHANHIYRHLIFYLPIFGILGSNDDYTIFYQEETLCSKPNRRPSTSSSSIESPRA